MSSKLQVMARLEFELVYNDVAVYHISHYPTSWNICIIPYFIINFDKIILDQGVRLLTVHAIKK